MPDKGTVAIVVAVPTPHKGAAAIVAAVPTIVVVAALAIEPVAVVAEAQRIIRLEIAHNYFLSSFSNCWLFHE